MPFKIQKKPIKPRKIIIIDDASAYLYSRQHLGKSDELRMRLFPTVQTARTNKQGGREIMAEAKGIVLSAWLAYLHQRYGKEAVNKALEELSIEDRFQLTSPILSSSWYPYGLFFAFERLTVKLANPSDKLLSFHIGEYTAEFVFNGVYRSVIAKDPIRTVEKFDWIKDFFYQDALILETEINSATECLVRYRYEAGAAGYRGRCEGLRGFWNKTLEMSGATAVHSTHQKCVKKNATYCEFHFQW
jgi:hypothetical protein